MKISIPTRVTRPRTYRQAQAHEISEVPYHIKGTGIPASTLAKFRSGEWTPGQRTLDKLRLMHQRYMYSRMRSVGVPADHARRARHWKVSRAIDYIDKYRNVVQTISQGKDIESLYIAWGVSLSSRNIPEWDIYIRDKGYPEPDAPEDMWWEPEDLHDEFEGESIG